MKKLGIVSYNIYGNFTNYGSALQTYALHRVLNEINPVEYESIVIDYCPDILLDKNPLDPVKNMWDTNLESRRQCEAMIPYIKVNYKKFKDFYNSHYRLSKIKYTSSNFEDSLKNESLDGYVCGSDTIFCVDEFGFDDGYYSNYKCMKNSFSIAYAASFGDTTYTPEVLDGIEERLRSNFDAIALRENEMIDFVSQKANCSVFKVLDPTLMLKTEDYYNITASVQVSEKYILLYVRRYNEAMEKYARRLSKETGLRIIEISLRAENAKFNEMRYDAGVEEFLALVKNAEYVVTNSYHGMIFAIQFSRSFYVFSREQCNTKIIELLNLLGIQERLLITGDEKDIPTIDYAQVHEKINKAREDSYAVLKKMLLL